MLAQRIWIAAPNQVEWQEFAFDPTDLAPDEVSIETAYSLVSPGTELTCINGLEGSLTSWARLPMTPGYAASGRVIATGEAVHYCQVGDLVHARTPHASHAKARQFVFPLAPGADLKTAPFGRLAGIAMNSLRMSSAELGDYVAVIGLGLVGNLAAQLFTLAGCRVIGIDRVPERLQLAERCGVRYTALAGVDLREHVAEITSGEMCPVVVEATGLPPVAMTAAELCNRNGEVILLGSPRAECQANVTTLLRQVHMDNVRFIGALKGPYPERPDRAGIIKHSIDRDVYIVLDLIATRQLHAEQLITHELAPCQFQVAYDGVRDDPAHFVTALFDWSRV